MSDICERIEQLLKEEENPQVAQKYITELLDEAGLTHGLPWKESPMGFCMNLESALNQLDPTAINWPTSPLNVYENAEELVLILIPAELD